MLNAVGMVMTTRGHVFLKHKDPARLYRVRKRGGDGLQIDRGPDKGLRSVWQLLLEIVNETANCGPRHELRDRFIQLGQIIYGLLVHDS